MAISINWYRYLIQLNHKGVKSLEIERFPLNFPCHNQINFYLVISLSPELHDVSINSFGLFDTLRLTNAGSLTGVVTDFLASSTTVANIYIE